MPAAWVLASPFETAKEDNAQREYYFVGTLTNNGDGMAKMLRRGRFTTGAVGAFAPAEIQQWVQCTRPERGKEGRSPYMDAKK